MTKNWVPLLFAGVLIFSANPAYSQLDQELVSKRAQWERFLKTAKILRHEDVGEGITKPKRMYMKLGEMEASGCWKNPDGVQKGFKEDWQYEIAAYKLDQYLGMGMVPPTVERRFRTSKGSLQLWVNLERSELDRQQNDIPIPPDKSEHCEKMLFLARAFDSLIANIDRTQQNIRWTKDWRLILIDHSRSFRTKRIYNDQLIYGPSGLRKTMGFDMLPREFVSKIRTLDYDTVKQVVGNYLSHNEIQCMLKRHKLLIKEIDRMIQENGESSVLY